MKNKHINRRTVLVFAVLLIACSSAFGQQYRSITALRFNYYTDDRSSLNTRRSSSFPWWISTI